MKIAVAQRGEFQLAQVIYIGDDLHWTDLQRIQNELSNWVAESCKGHYIINGWQFYFADEQDLMLFLLRWDGNDGG